MHTDLYICRRERRLTQKQVAQLLLIHPQSYHLKEKGKTEFTLSEAQTLATYFKMSVDELFPISQTKGKEVI